MAEGNFDRHQTEMLGRIDGIVGTLPARFDALARQFTALDEKFDKHQLDDNKRFSRLEKKANIITGTVTALTAVAAGISSLFWHKS